MAEDDIARALATLLEFVAGEPLTDRVARLEHDLEGLSVAEMPSMLQGHQITESLLRSALLARDSIGRINDIIHACAISLALPNLLVDGEVLRRPSLAAGNDPSRPFDVETNLRVAEFKLSRWRGSDAARKRHVFKDLVHLAADQSGRKAELYVLGPEPARFLRTTRSHAAWGLDKFPATQALFHDRFGSLDVSISSFVTGPGSRVTLVDLEQRLPRIFGGLQ